jgi:hypothetical protein
MKYTCEIVQTNTIVEEIEAKTDKEALDKIGDILENTSSEELLNKSQRGYWEIVDIQTMEE